MDEKQEKSKKKQVNILLDEKDVEMLDILARDAGFITRSAMLRLLLRRTWKSYIKNQKGGEGSL